MIPPSTGPSTGLRTSSGQSPSTSSGQRPSTSSGQRLVAIVGPTAVGKSHLALRLAQALEGEILSADSRQVYRSMDIGTDKPTPAQRALVPHHLIDLVDPDEPFTVVHYQELAACAIQEVHQRGRLPLLVGGTGLYVRAVTEGLSIPRVPPDPALRRSLEQRAEQEGGDALYRELQAVDPEAAQRIDSRNLRRVVRALEVWHHTGSPISLLQRRRPPPYRVLRIGLTTDRSELYRRIDARVERELADGLVEEVRRLVARGYGSHLPSMTGLGYRQMGAYLRGEIDMPTVVQRLKYDTHRFARQQNTWFRLVDPTIRWFDASADPFGEVVQYISNWLPGKGEEVPGEGRAS